MNMLLPFLTMASLIVYSCLAPNREFGNLKTLNDFYYSRSQAPFKGPSKLVAIYIYYNMSSKGGKYNMLGYYNHDDRASNRFIVQVESL
ncbi:hypothetical protein CLU79DRAFT_728540 [Phycomyces nitens]|nr:hypothetical protein CLU79DRAFT_728540 [Phycomyces nitens]